MKYLKSYNEVLLIDPTGGADIGIYCDLLDIGLELTDDNFAFDVSFPTEKSSKEYWKNSRFKLFIHHKKYQKFKITEIISEVIERIKDYMTSKGYKCNVYYRDDQTDISETPNDKGDYMEISMNFI